MTSKEKLNRSGCPINFGLELFGDRWTLLVIRDLVFAGKRHFREMLASAEKISTNILTDWLKRLEESGIICRQANPQNGREVVYTLTEKGADLIPVLLEIIRWGGKYDERTATPENFLNRIENEREMLIEQIRNGDFKFDDSCD